jgi:hypothetical protein
VSPDNEADRNRVLLDSFGRALGLDKDEQKGILKGEEDCGEDIDTSSSQSTDSDSAHDHYDTNRDTLCTLSSSLVSA